MVDAFLSIQKITIGTALTVMQAVTNIELIKAAKKIDFIPALEWLATEFNLGPVPKE